MTNLSKPTDTTATHDKQNKQNRQSGISRVVNDVANVVGWSVMTTTLAMTAHHLWRKKYTANAKVSDYFDGLAQKVRQAEQRGYQTTVSNQTTASNQTQSEHKIKPAVWVSGVANRGMNGDFDDFSVVGIDKNRQIVWQTHVPERVHDIVVQPQSTQNREKDEAQNQNQDQRPATVDKTNADRDIAVMGRRPSEYFWVMNCATGDISHRINAEENHHFYGHACYSLDGKRLYVTENNTENFAGLIGVYDVAEGYNKVAEFATSGIGPHELIMHPDGDKLIIANGGIKTERASREELNLDSMRPSLVYLSLNQDELGKVLQKIEPKHNQMSVRHISVMQAGELTGEVAVAIQFQGEKHLNMPLVLSHKFGDDSFSEYYPTTDWRQFHHYIASVMVNSQANLICVTSPIGGCVSVFDMTTKGMIDTLKIADCAGIAIQADGFLVSDGQGGLTLLSVDKGKVDKANNKGKLVADRVSLPMAFDNHMQSVAFEYCTDARVS